MIPKIRNYKSLFLIEFMDRPYYAYTVYQAALQAVQLGHKRMSIIEFGVAGGNGLVCLEKHVKRISEKLGIHINIYGFDTGEGLPQLVDYRDIPHTWQPGFFKMDYEKLMAKLSLSQVVLGNIETTLRTFYQEYNPDPIGAILFDVDLYSSTKAAFQIFQADSKFLLPRVRCYFDDILGNDISLTNEYTGERLAIHEYNALLETKKITPVYHLLGKMVRKKWYSKCFVHHMFNHPQYCQFLGKPNQEIPLAA
ncbi:MAG: hypothetical protein FJX03_04090 [Alphaproteobacteria bacterium]|nr:hypothetical protein [Alphaproteobacteria bacterium]